VSAPRSTLTLYRLCNCTTPVMIVLFQQRDGLTVLDRMRPNRRLIALHRRFKTPAEPDLSGPKKLGQVFSLRAHQGIPHPYSHSIVPGGFEVTS
jgi:hypothetical protein